MNWQNYIDARQYKLLHSQTANTQYRAIENDTLGMYESINSHLTRNCVQANKIVVRCVIRETQFKMNNNNNHMNEINR